MSSLIVEVCAVEEIAPHSNADRLEKVRVKNWWCIAGKGHYKVGDKCVFVPPDAILPEELANRWGIAKFLAPLGRNIDGSRPTGLRVRAASFRGERSYGTVQDVDDPTWLVGMDLLDHFGITKYEPPVKSHAGDAAPEIAAFHAYTDIENFGNFPGVFTEGEEVVIDEKIHGTNCRVGLIPTADGGQFDNLVFHEYKMFVAGSHGVRRKEFDAAGKPSLYWMPLWVNTDTKNVVREMLEYIFERSKSPVVLFGEIYGPGVQDMHYGLDFKTFRVFDMSVGGKYLDYDEKTVLWEKFGIPAVPVIYRGPFSLKVCEELVNGPTTVCNPGSIKEPFKGREGIVIRPVHERFDPTLGGRAILKYVSVDYHERKNKNQSEDH